MSNIRLFLLLALGLVGFQLWLAWQQDYGRPAATAATEAAPATAATEAASAAEGEVPTPATSPSEAPAAAPPAVDALPEASNASATGRTVIIENDVLRLHVSTRGAEIEAAELLKYSVSLEQKDTPVKLLTREFDRWFIAQSGLNAAQGSPALPNHTAELTIDGDRHALAPGADTLEVPFTWTDGQGVSVRKVLSLSRGSYVLNVRDVIDNQGGTTVQASQYRQFQRVPPPRPSSFAFSNPELYAFVGAAVYSPDQHFTKLDFANFESEPYARSFAGGWSAMQQHYFVSAFIPKADEITQYETKILAGGNGLPTRYLLRQSSPTLAVAPGQSATLESRLYIGPKLQRQLDEVAPGLEYTVDYGIVTFLAVPLFWVMDHLHKLVGNWGLAIILLTLLVKLAFYRLSEAQYRSMAKMKKVQPRLEQLKERYGDNREKLAQAQLELFKQEKVNPLGGCLPILVQMPVFIALYWVIFESVELRQAPFFLWIQDLSVKDPFFILPVLNVLVMWYTQKLSPTPGMDPVQRRVLQTMPLVFGVLFAFFPAGLVLYWLANGLLGLIQQLVIMRRVEGAK